MSILLIPSENSSEQCWQMTTFLQWHTWLFCCNWLFSLKTVCGLWLIMVWMRKMSALIWHQEAHIDLLCLRLRTRPPQIRRSATSQLWGACCRSQHVNRKVVELLQKSEEHGPLLQHVSKRRQGSARTRAHHECTPNCRSLTWLLMQQHTHFQQGNKNPEIHLFRARLLWHRARGSVRGGMQFKASYP